MRPDQIEKQINGSETTDLGPILVDEPTCIRFGWYAFTSVQPGDDGYIAWRMWEWIIKLSIEAIQHPVTFFLLGVLGMYIHLAVDIALDYIGD